LLSAAERSERVHDHPSAASLEGFLLGELPPWEVKIVVAHLARGCRRCEAKVESLSLLLFGTAGNPGDAATAGNAGNAGNAGDTGPLGHPAAAAVAASDEEYDGAIDRAVAAALAAAGVKPASPDRARGPLSLDRQLLLRARALPRPLPGPPRPPRNASPTPLCEELIAKSRACRHDDPQRMIHFAKLARFAANNLDPDHYGPQTAIDMQARTLAELANAYRVADDLERADTFMQQAVEKSASGSGDPLLLARLMDLLASLYCHRRQFEAAIELLDAVHAIYRDHGDEHQAGRALISQGLYTSYANDPRQALVLLTDGFERIDPAAEPELSLAAVHNILVCLMELGRSREARPLLDRFGPLYERCGGRLNALKLRWVEGKIAAGCDDLKTAERCFVEVRQGFEETGLALHGALVSLDLTSIWLRENRISEARGLVEQVIATFKALNIGREALAALLLLRDALAHQGTALGMLTSLTDCLKRIEQTSGLRFEPDGT
jgi:tetratricopeptide (TPR) repeat protein